MSGKKIDVGIKDLIYKLNQVPFVKTIASCEGHLIHERLLTKKFPPVKADKGYNFVHDGYLYFRVDKKHDKAQKFLDDLKELQSKYSFVSLADKMMLIGPKGFSISPDGDHSLTLHSSDLLPSKTIRDSNRYKYEADIRSGQIKSSIAQQRLKKHKNVWEDFLKIAEKYVD